MDVRVGLWRRLSTEELMLLNCGVESPLGCKEIKPVHPKGNQPWIFLWKDWCWGWNSNTLATWCKELTHWKDPDAGKYWRQGERGMTEDEMVGWHHRFIGHEFEQAPGVGDGQGSLVCCSPWGLKESDTTEWLKWTEQRIYLERTIIQKHTWTPMFTAGLFSKIWKQPECSLIDEWIKELWYIYTVEYYSAIKIMK